MKKLEVEIRSMKVYCEKLDKEVEIEFEKIYWERSEQECEICGSHGHVSVSFKCECGKDHEIILKDW